MTVRVCHLEKHSRRRINGLSAANLVHVFGLQVSGVRQQQRRPGVDQTQPGPLRPRHQVAHPQETRQEQQHRHAGRRARHLPRPPREQPGAAVQDQRGLPGRLLQVCRRAARSILPLVHPLAGLCGQNRRPVPIPAACPSFRVAPGNGAVLGAGAAGAGAAADYGPCPFALPWRCPAPWPRGPVAPWPAP